ncbi:hypothetical protein C0583_01275 [Candidatus Parcubacteria bacterium]|nr:MAG: hypothetical protein C0583_01275 [Candidatus Parcubacteria bacterium]
MLSNYYFVKKQRRKIEFIELLIFVCSTAIGGIGLYFDAGLIRSILLALVCMVIGLCCTNLTLNRVYRKAGA